MGAGTSVPVPPAWATKTADAHLRWIQSLTDDQWFAYCNDKGIWYGWEDAEPLSDVPDRVYFCYGSNLHRFQMKDRCPDAEALHAVTLQDWQLVFRGVADVVPCEGKSVDGALWLISEADEKALDRYEGYPSNYRKEYITLTADENEVGTAMMYVMNTSPTNIYRPGAGYFMTLCEGFLHFDLDTNKLMGAFKRASRFEGNPAHTVPQYKRKTGAKFKTGPLSKPATLKVAGKILDAIKAGLITPEFGK